MAFLYNESSSLEQIVLNYGYPCLTNFQESPLILSLKFKHFNFAEQLFKALSKYQYSLVFSYEEMKFMLKSDYSFVKKLLNLLCKQIYFYTNTKIKIPIFNHLIGIGGIYNSSNGHFTLKDIEQFEDKKVIAELQDPYAKQLSNSKHKSKDQESFDEELDKENEEGQNLLVKIHGESSRSKKRSQQQYLNKNFELKAKEYTEVYQINGFYNFDRGSFDYIYFLYQFSKSKSSEFVLSNWNKILQVRWKESKQFFYLLGVVYFLYFVFLTVYLRHGQSKALLIITLILLSVIMVYELVPVAQQTSIATMNLKTFLNFFTYLLSYITIYLTFDSKNYTQLIIKIFQIFNEAVVIYQGIYYLRAFEKFRYITGMINNLIISLLDVILIMIYLMVGFAILLDILLNYQGLYQEFINILFMSFGSFPKIYQINFGEMILIMLVIFILSIILLNFLIAKMTNKYQEIYKDQKAQGFREISKLLMVYEIWYKLLFGKKNQKKYITYFVLRGDEPNFKQIIREEEIRIKKQRKEELYENINRVQNMIGRLEQQCKSNQQMEQIQKEQFKRQMFTQSENQIKSIQSQMSRLEQKFEQMMEKISGDKEEEESKKQIEEEKESQEKIQ